MHKSQLHNVHTFESPAEFGNFALSTNLAFKNRANSDDSWHGNITAMLAANMAVKGDDKNVIVAEKMLEKFDTHVETSCFLDMPSVAGCYPCVPEALAGDPECMREPVEIANESAPITIIVDTSCSANVDSFEMEKRGIAILAVVMALTASRPVTLKAICVNHGYTNPDGDAYSIVTVDIPTTPIDLATTAFVLTHIGFTRHLMYGYTYKYQGWDGNCWPRMKGIDTTSAEGLNSAEYEERIKKYLEITGETLILPPAFSEDGVIQNPEQWIKEQLARFQHRQD